MQIAIESTDIVTKIDGVECRLWEGMTADGTPCKVFVHRVAVHKDQDATQFERELKEQLQPAKYVPLALIL